MLLLWCVESLDFFCCGDNCVMQYVLYNNKINDTVCHTNMGIDLVLLKVIVKYK